MPLIKRTWQNFFYIDKDLKGIQIGLKTPSKDKLKL